MFCEKVEVFANFPVRKIPKTRLSVTGGFLRRKKILGGRRGAGQEKHPPLPHFLIFSRLE